MSGDVARTEPMSALEEFRAAMGGDAAIPGLEDVRQEDLTIPVIQIDHKQGLFVDKLTGETTPALEGILLGKLSSRILWPPQQSTPGQKPMPMCRSREAIQGKPNDNFPWKDWGEGKKKNPEWSPEAMASDTLSCATCYFAQWGSDPKTDGPRCTLQYTFPMLEAVAPYKLKGLFTVQRTGIKPANAYISGFVRDASPIFTHVTHLSLQVNQNGSVQYAVPTFKRGDATPSDVTLWKEWAEQYSKIKSGVQGRDLGDSATVEAKPTATSGGKAF